MFNNLANWVNTQKDGILIILTAIVTLVGTAMAIVAAIHAITKFSKHDWKEGSLYLAGAILIGIIAIVAGRNLFMKFGEKYAPNELTMLPIMLPAMYYNAKDKLNKFKKA